ncbi:hypothetical protein EJB05_12607 [Eragrostis curvula]|uniref:FBD domain-containing protein n=1 Tax=Eragrostis curvula TaxID=38414 RepID=A0A5J9VSS9_9POAL|nr:hypothetical protein EJB05_12607 [Eragrostis curvula]
MEAYPALGGNRIAVESMSLEELNIHVWEPRPAELVIVAPELRKFSLSYDVLKKFTVSHSVPKLEEFLLQYTCKRPCVAFGHKLCLHRLRMETRWSDENGDHPPVRVHVLSLRILPLLCHTSMERSFAQEVARLPVNEFSVLELSVETGGHIAQRIVTAIKMAIGGTNNSACLISEMWKLKGSVQQIMRSAPMLKRMNVKHSDEVSPSDGGCQKLRSIFEADASVQCNFEFGCRVGLLV